MFNTTYQQYLKLLCPPVIVASVIFYLSCLISPSNLPAIELDLLIPVDKFVHFTMYFGLSLVAMCNYIYINKGKVKKINIFIFCLLLPILYGGLIEILQDRYFGREGDWYDFLANSIGVISAIPFAIYFLYWLKPIRNNDMKS